MRRGDSFTVKNKFNVLSAIALVFLVMGLTQVVQANEELAAPQDSAIEEQAIDFQAMGWASACVTCHGATTRAVPGQVIPPIAGQSVDEFMRKMQHYHQSDEPGVLMVQTIKGYDAQVLRRIAQWYAQQD